MGRLHVALTVAMPRLKRQPDRAARETKKAPAMFRRISICTMLIVFGACPLKAQPDAERYEARLQRIELSAAGFDLVLATPRPDAATVNLHSAKVTAL